MSTNNNMLYRIVCFVIQNMKMCLYQKVTEFMCYRENVMINGLKKDTESDFVKKKNNMVQIVMFELL